jgi:L-seryl-tRNA(Ser) seleniumtransferase
MADNAFRDLPSVHEILETPALRALAASHPRAVIADAIRSELNELRSQLSHGHALDGASAADVIAARVTSQLAQDLAPRLRSVINATGIVLHTNLGRAPMAAEAAEAASRAAARYLNLELDLATGKRSSRHEPVRHWLCRLTGAQSAVAVNNNAAATVLVLHALCQGKEVVISRGQLIEIGGSFRIPEIMATSGAILREVGTTNITRLRDYERAIGPNTGALLRVHPSNYRVSGFTQSVPLAELVQLAQPRGLPVIDDIGSGALIDLGSFGFEGEPVARSSIEAGADVVLFSGDKLLGGPQAGLIVGRREFIERLEKDPLMRAFRLDKMTLAALEATLRLYLDEKTARTDIPVLRLLAMPLGELQSRAEWLAQSLQALSNQSRFSACQDEAYVGGGSLPDQKMKTWVMAIEPASDSVADIALRLRLGEPPVIVRTQGGRILIDLRTVFPDQDAALTEAIVSALAASAESRSAKPLEQ